MFVSMSLCRICVLCLYVLSVYEQKVDFIRHAEGIHNVVRE